MNNQGTTGENHEKHWSSLVIIVIRLRAGPLGSDSARAYRFLPKWDSPADLLFPVLPRQNIYKKKKK
jgi:cytochrome b